MRLFILLSIILFICSCNSPKTNQNDIISPQVANKTTKVIDLFPTRVPMITNISDIASDITYIPLETSKNSKIDFISEIAACNNNMYISTLKEVFCFDQDGQFLYKLSMDNMNFKESDNIIYDFDVSSDEKMLAILSNNKILEFSNTGTEFHFLKTIDLKQPFPSKFSFVPGTNNILLSLIPSRGSESTLNLLINANGDTLMFKPNCYRYARRDKLPYGSVDEIIHYKVENCLCFKEEFSDTIFYFNDLSNEYKPRLILDSHGNTVRPWMRGDGNMISMYDSIYRVQTIFETSKFLFYSYTLSSGSGYNIVYDKSSDKKFEINRRNGLKDDITGGHAFDLIHFSDAKLYSWISAKELKRYIKSDEFAKAQVQDSQRKESVKSLADSLKDTDNLILIILTIKN